MGLVSGVSRQDTKILLFLQHQWLFLSNLAKKRAPVLAAGERHDSGNLLNLFKPLQVVLESQRTIYEHGEEVRKLCKPRRK